MGYQLVTYSREAVFAAVSDPTRRAVLDLLRGGDRPVGLIAQEFPLSRPAISKHLGLLRRAQLVEERRSGRQRIYRLNPAPLQVVESWVAQYREFWRDTLADLKRFVESRPKPKRSATRRNKKKGSL